MLILLIYIYGSHIPWFQLRFSKTILILWHWWAIASYIHRACLYPLCDLSHTMSVNEFTGICSVQSLSLPSRLTAFTTSSVQCVPDISRAIFCKLLTKDSPLRARYCCLSWVLSLTAVLPPNLLCCVQYHVMLYSVTCLQRPPNGILLCLLQQKLLVGVHWYLQSPLKHITE